MTSALPATQRTLVAVAAAILLSGCATVPPASTAPPTGWPQTPVATSGAAPSLTESPTPTSSAATTVEHLGFTVPVPAGYTDATDLVGAQEPVGRVELIAFLRGPDQHQILVQRVASDRKTLETYVSWYVSQAKEEGSKVTAQHAAYIGDERAIDLTVASADGAKVTLIVCMPTAGEIVTVTGPLTSATRHDDMRFVAQGLVLG